jgi:DNA-binding response OmpR family regulator
MKKVLILEDEENIRSFVVINLQRAGYTVVEAGTGKQALNIIRTDPDIGVAILDIMLPDIDGFEVCRGIRATTSQMGIIMLTARTQEIDKVTGLMTGADDYVTKPFSPLELVARVDALYRRLGGDPKADTSILRYGPLVMNLKSRTLEKKGVRIRLTQMEYAVMKLFMQNPGIALSRESILSSVWGKDGNVEVKIVDVNVRRLRLKLEEDPTNPMFISTVWGVGYKFGS